jgi:type IV secretory pathway VirJ component
MAMRINGKQVLGIAMVSLAALLGACAGREAAPVQVNQAGDVDKSCHELMAELNHNDYRMARLVKESEHVQSKNADVAGGDAFFFPPVLVAYDQGKAQNLELRTLQERNKKLTQLAVDKDC